MMGGLMEGWVVALGGYIQRGGGMDGYMRVDSMGDGIGNIGLVY